MDPHVPYAEALEKQLHIAAIMRRRGPVYFDEDICENVGGILNDARPEAIYGIHMDALEKGTPYYWAPHYCDMLVSTASTLPGWTVRFSDLLTPHGFCWFAKPLIFDTGDGTFHFQGLGWAVAVVMFPYEQGHLRPPDDPLGRNWDAVRALTLQFYTGGPSYLPIGLVGAHENDDLVNWTEDLGEDYTAVPGLAEWQGRIAGAAIAFMQQQIVVAPEHPAPRATRRRLARQGIEHVPLIRVIELRRKRPLPANGEPEPVDWQYQWMVAGHWRKQWYASEQRHKSLWIAPYLKGPESKPLKPPSQRVFAVVR